MRRSTICPRGLIRGTLTIALADNARLAASGAAWGFVLQVHQALGGKTDHLTQQMSRRSASPKVRWAALSSVIVGPSGPSALQSNRLLGGQANLRNVRAKVPDWTDTCPSIDVLTRQFMPRCGPSRLLDQRAGLGCGKPSFTRIALLFGV